MIDRLFLRYRNTFTIYFQIIQLIEHLEAGIEQRILWQNRFSYVAVPSPNNASKGTELPANNSASAKPI